VTISQSALTTFSLNFSESTGAASSPESMHHLWCVSVMISELAATKFSLTISQSTGAVGADESTRHLWNRFRWWFRRQMWFSFH
jgi:hypothetical protein